MPKRNAAYMEGQREHILRKALEVMLEKGLADTSIRDICSSAGVSIGAFYTHFADRQEAVFAACALDVMSQPKTPIVGTWVDYEAQLLSTLEQAKALHVRKRLRLSYQFVGEIAVYDRPLPGVDDVFKYHTYWFRGSLQAMAEAGEIEMPLGLERTTWLHAKLYYGTIHIMIIDKARQQELFAELVAGLALIAVRRSPGS
jgi:AcrR family transcriptional regulator